MYAIVCMCIVGVCVCVCLCVCVYCYPNHEEIYYSQYSLLLYSVHSSKAEEDQY